MADTHQAHDSAERQIGCLVDLVREYPPDAMKALLDACFDWWLREHRKYSPFTGSTYSAATTRGTASRRALRLVKSASDLARVPGPGEA